MIIIRNKIIPFGRGMLAINLFGFIFAKRPLSAIEQNHEYIHTMQQRELLYVGFYLLYVVEWLVWLFVYRNILKAYFRISFEREAYDRQNLLNYRKSRRFCAWLKYL